MSKPEVGMGATMYVGSDRYPYTVIAVSPSGFKVTLQADDSKRTDSNGLSEIQTWDCTPNPNGAIRYAYRNRHGRYYAARGYSRVTFGERDMYQDPHF